MKVLLLCLISLLLAIAVTCQNETIKEFLDPNEDEDNVFLWKHLFIKLNKMLSDNERINQNLLDINKRLDDLTKRQDNQEATLTVLLDNIQKIGAEDSKGHDDQETHLKKLMNEVQEFVKSQETQTRRVNDLVQTVQQITTNKKLNEPWTTVQRRQDGGINFYRNWEDYKMGFGNPNADFFIGLERLHQLTTNQEPQELLIVLTDFDNQSRYALYDKFRIGNETEKYAIMELGTYKGDAGDGLNHHRGQPFSTFDRDNNRGKIRNCPENFQGAWWFYDGCYNGHLNGPYREQSGANNWGVSWHAWRGWNKSMKYAAMMIRPKL